MESISILNLFDVKGKVALVTGGTSGGLVYSGAKVYICGLAKDPISEIEAQLNEIGLASSGCAIGSACDLTSKEGVNAVSTRLRASESHLDILISNAGIRLDTPSPCDYKTASISTIQSSLFSSNYEGWIYLCQLNVIAHYFLSVALLDLLAAAGERSGKGNGRETGSGVAVIMSSAASLHNATDVDLMSYSTTKAVTDHLVKLLATKFVRWYVRVCGINPGAQTASSEDFGGPFDKAPARRAGRIEDLVGVVLFLCSKAGSFIDGSSVVIDGGRTLFANK